MALVGPPAPLLAQLADRLQHDRHLLDGVHGAAVAPVRLGHLGVPGAALDRDRRRQRPAASHPHVERRRLGDDAGVGLDAVADRGQTAGARRLLVGDRVHDQVAAQAYAGLGQRHRRERHRGNAALHVAGAAAVEVPAAHLRGVGVARPAVARLRRHHVDVPVEQQAAPAARAGEAGGHLGPSLEAERARDLARARHLVGTRLPDLDLGAGGGQQPAQVLLQRGLVMGRPVALAGGGVEVDQRRRRARPAGRAPPRSPPSPAAPTSRCAMIPARGRSGSPSATARDAQPPARPGAPPPRGRDRGAAAAPGGCRLRPRPALAERLAGRGRLVPRRVGWRHVQDERPGRVLAAGHRPQADRHRHAVGGGRHDARLRRHARAGSGHLLRRRALRR